MAAFFWASMCSLNEGFGGPLVLFENPNPGLAAAAASGFFGEFGLSGAFSNNLCWVGSKPDMMLFHMLALGA